MSYICWGEERGENGTFHLQGYVRFTTRKTLDGAKKLLNDRMHLEPAKGNEEQNRNYCKKDGQFTEHGTFDADNGKKGRRTDLLTVAEKIKNGASVKEVAMDHPETFIINHAGIEKLAKIVKPKPPSQRAVTTTILWGPTATGKTHRVRTSYPGVYSVRPGKNPWDDYDGEDAILFDEFRCEDWTIVEMNMYLDKWPCRLNCRYNNKEAAWTKVFICANTNPDNWYPNESYMVSDAFKRRITRSYEVLNQEQIIQLEDTPPAPAPTAPLPSSPDSSPVRPKALKRTFAMCALPNSPSLSQENTQFITID